MRNRRFLLLAAVLVALNAALWLAPAGLALRQVLVQQLFGKNLMRAEVKLKNGQDWRVDRGVVTQVNSSQLTLTEADGHIQTIGISSGTNVIGASGSVPQSAVTRGWRVLVTWPAASGNADLIKLEKRVKVGGGNRGSGGRHSHR
ncbi:MAG: hypothetical protein ACRDLM_05840 [Gaiellaceae bacterium]